jgi:hypothetical protein
MQCPPSLLAQLINNKGLFPFEFEQRVLLNILGIILKDIQKSLFIIMLYFLEHFLTFLIKILSRVKMLFLILLLILFFNFLDLLVLGFVQAQDVSEVTIVY